MQMVYTTLPLSQNLHLSNYPCKWTAGWWHQYFKWAHFPNIATPKTIPYRATEGNYHKIWFVRVGSGRSWIPTLSNKSHHFRTNILHSIRGSVTRVSWLPSPFIAYLTDAISLLLSGLGTNNSLPINTQHGQTKLGSYLQKWLPSERK